MLTYNDAAAAAYYEDPAHRQATGPGRKRTRPRLTSHVPIRFDPEMIEEIKRLSDEDGMTVSAWVRQVVRREIQRRHGKPGDRK
jgi:hypothetical protein